MIKQGEKICIALKAFRNSKTVDIVLLYYVSIRIRICVSLTRLFPIFLLGQGR